MIEIRIPSDHPRAKSLRLRETLIHYWNQNVVANAGLIAHGRGEAFDYLIGETTIPPAREATAVAAAHLVLARHPVISVNGNSAALASSELVNLSRITGAKLEVNLFHRTPQRISAVAKLLHSAGASDVLGLGDGYATIREVSSERRIVDPEGILIADVVLVPLEDGDRTEAIRNLGKTVIAVDLNPLSRTSQSASVTIVDNVVRAIPNLISEVSNLKTQPKEELQQIVNSYDNDRTLAGCLRFIQERLHNLAGLEKVV